MRRKPGALLPLEVAILRTALTLGAGDEGEFHGYQIASQLRDGGESRTLTAHGTLYKALTRMRKAGLLSDRWEDPATAAAEERPRRRLYLVTAQGVAALRASEREQATGFAPGVQPA
jgi:PadR family transcriptional regulator PadR